MELIVAAIRHPMPYGDLEKQAVQRFSKLEDLDLHECTIEERADLVLIGTPIDLGKLLDLNKPSTRVRYELEISGQPNLEDILEATFKKASG
jgi:predicted GTPase